MSARKKLAGKRIAVLAADGFEKTEQEAPVAALKEAGAQVVTVALHSGKIRGMNMHQPAELLHVDKTVHDARADDYDGLFIPGGYFSLDLLRQSALARDFVRSLNALGKPIALISQAPALLTSAGLATSRTLTSSPGMRDDMVNAGATWRNEDLVRDANWLSSRGNQEMEPFITEMIALFAGEAGNSSLLGQAHSDPPGNEPSQMPDQPLRWLATPSVRTMLSLALLGVGVVAASRGRRGKHAAGPESPRLPKPD